MSAQDDIDLKAEEEEVDTKLKLQPQPPAFPFVNQPFEIGIYLVDKSDNVKTGHEIPLKVELLDADGFQSIRQDILKIDSNAIIGSNGVCTITASIKECSMNFCTKGVVISISGGNSELGTVKPVLTHCMNVVQHRLLIKKELPELWYKDEGGRDKCIVIPILLVDKHGATVTNRKFPLKVTLLYENERPVAKQDILRVSSESQQSIDSFGQARLKIRIEDVSKNHQGQSFRVKVEPDLQDNPGNNDISYDLSTAIAVRSKRNKRSRHKLSPLQGERSVNPSSDATHSLPHLIVNTPASSIQVSSSISNAQSQTPAGAMAGVIQWAGHVVNGLHALEWKLVGYEMKQDGTPDQSKPIYRCPSCWRYKDMVNYHTAQHGSNCVIANILMIYATETMQNLHTLLKVVEGNSLSNDQLALSNNSNKTFQSHAEELDSDMLDSSIPVPLTRGITDVIKSIENDTTFIGGNGLNDFMTSITGTMSNQLNSTNLSLEHHVYYVLARMLASNSGTVGFPAFDTQQQLIGFYQEMQGVTGTEVSFIPLQSVPISDQDVIEAQRLLINEAKTNTGAVFSLQRSNNDLVKLKEDALMFHWSNRAGDLNSLF